MVSAKENVVYEILNKCSSVIVSEKALIKSIKSDNPVFIGVETWCGKTFYLDLNDYKSVEDFYKDAAKFQEQQCALSPKPNTFLN
jgi:hypothetical protein